ncbi:hypothetical protein LUZ60_011049 [Juncus effusus]|nr:hypothetical protein LUZ60_011049 [Juncus effusus]
MVKKEGSSYEEERRKRVLENRNKLENLGISTISKSLLEVAKSEYKQLKCNSSPKSKKKFEVEVGELRRSSRARNQVSYHDQVDETELRSYRKRYCRSNESGREYTGRVSSYEEQALAFQKAEQIQNSLNNPSFVKTMVRSHVSSCFWLGLPSKFCKEHLPQREVTMVLEDEAGAETDAVYIGFRTGLSGGWRGFAMERNLEDGDSLVFELVEPHRFKIYIVKAIEDDDDRIVKAVESGGENEDSEIAEVDKEEDAESAKEEESEEQEVRKTRSSQRLKKTRKKQEMIRRTRVKQI